ncbi:Laccase domain protein [Paenibacillus larvae subsp. larvae]|uniref:Purine nucleoside phosphorylase n=1 Tax=Paenibacillus larvae subsp. larvae TaxID=147375 RepID=A0A2L1UG37_9BACL|nr:peptidoglycan editing factor PgeF [Paenibacillus larvae]AQT83852.1 multicopper polyphenol oxidase [Paenibacillus larvae subsp. pulvifaciens]AQZ45292.1 multicopper polyphenol oxidase [Paenibacillus larvae subsp. pulvifaciens]AVF27237.1 Laccase domain protein [Paenibacillus larvae subsp. larvae]AVF31900.1 Laccase domain protein [Paenibacillus larvae subsp. larvae]MBH0343266.1 multicopper polyphenol oxidase [Paenibacillus larvae]
MEPFVAYERQGEPSLFFLERWMKDFPELTAGFTSRRGGFSHHPFESFNIGLHVQDRPEDVIHNRHLLAKTINMPFDALTFGEQVHGSKVAVVTAEDRGKGRLSRKEAIQDKDAFITNESNLVLCALYADCVPLFFFDPVKKAMGIAHAGWKGTALNIASATVKAMNEQFGTKPEDLLGAVGPSIGVCCYEVNDAVVDQVKKALGEQRAKPETVELIIQEQEKGTYQLNLQECNRFFMQKAGILSSRIEVTQLCTSCSNEWFFSHRKEQGKTGRMAAWIALRTDDPTKLE